MFKVGDFVVCIKNDDDDAILYDLIIDQPYKVYRCHKGVDHDYIEVFGSTYVWETYNFLSMPDYIKKIRLEKIKKIEDVQVR